VISNTVFEIEDAQMVEAACRNLHRGVATPAEVAEIRAQCESGHALCVACEDGMFVFSAISHDGVHLELYVWIAVAFVHGAFRRQEPALLRIARDLGADTIAFRARRRGWARRLGPEWQRRGSDEFVRQVDG
jgi:hypothetical protein